MDWRRTYAEQGGFCEVEEVSAEEAARASVTECDMAERP
jgi:hypothetical protein